MVPTSATTVEVLLCWAAHFLICRRNVVGLSPCGSYSDSQQNFQWKNVVLNQCHAIWMRTTFFLIFFLSSPGQQVKRHTGPSRSAANGLRRFDSGFLSEFIWPIGGSVWNKETKDASASTLTVKYSSFSNTRTSPSSILSFRSPPPYWFHEHLEDVVEHPEYEDAHTEIYFFSTIHAHVFAEISCIDCSLINLCFFRAHNCLLKLAFSKRRIVNTREYFHAKKQANRAPISMNEKWERKYLILVHQRNKNTDKRLHTPVVLHCR